MTAKCLVLGRISTLPPLIPRNIVEEGVKRLKSKRMEMSNMKCSLILHWWIYSSYGYCTILGSLTTFIHGGLWDAGGIYWQLIVIRAGRHIFFHGSPGKVTPFQQTTHQPWSYKLHKQPELITVDQLKNIQITSLVWLEWGWLYKLIQRVLIS